MTHPASPDLTSEDPALLREYYRQMALVRSFELRAAEMYNRARIGGYCHLNLGEEATVVGLTAALRAEDYLLATYREHGYALARGADPGLVMAELFGRADGLSRGRGYRLRGHSVVDPARYRTAEVTERLRREDPLPAFRHHLAAGGILDEDAAAAMDADADKAVDRRRRLRRCQSAARGQGALRLRVREPSGRHVPRAARRPGHRGSAAMAVISYRQALHDTLRAELLRDENVLLIGEEIGVFEGSYKITAGLLDEFGPRRVRDTPICEEGFTGVAIGAAMMGLRPVVEIMTINFSLHGQQLSATHSQNLEVWYAHVPGLKVVAPAIPADAKGLLAAAIRDDDPVIVLENLALYNTRGEVPDGEHIAEIGRAAVLKPGRDITIVGYSRAAVIALDVARRLDADGISAEVIDLRSLRPLDRDTACASVRKTSRAVIVEDDWLSYGTGAEIAATIAEGAFGGRDAPVRRVAAAEVPLPYAKPLGTTMTLTLSIDHRAVDGATAAGFLTNLRELIEQPLGIVL